MGLAKGNTNNRNGRPKGSKNKITKDVRIVYTKLLESNLIQLQKDLKELTPKERVNVILKLSEFVIPKLRSVEMEGVFSREEYSEYERMKLEEQEFSNLSKEELLTKINQLQEGMIREKWDPGKDGNARSTK